MSCELPKSHLFNKAQAINLITAIDITLSIQNDMDQVDIDRYLTTQNDIRKVWGLPPFSSKWKL